MSARVTFATALRVLRQLRRDPRTLALVFLVPAVLLTLFRYVFDAQPETFDRIGGRHRRRLRAGGSGARGHDPAPPQPVSRHGHGCV